MTKLLLPAAITHSSLIVPIHSILIVMLAVTKASANAEPRFIRVQESAADGTLRITVPKAIAENLGITKHSTVKVLQEHKRMVVEAAK